MFTDHQPKWRFIVLLGTLVAVVAWCFVLLALGTKSAELLRSLPKFGLVFLLVWGAWLAFTRYAWRWECLRFKRWLVVTPDLNGRWVGKYVSMFDKKERKMTLEIHQTLLKLQCVAFGPDSVGEGYSVRLLSDGDDQNFKLVYFYHAKRKPTMSISGDEHEGVAVLRLIGDSPKRLEGYYVNDRHPAPHKGDIELRWDSAALKGQIE